MPPSAGVESGDYSSLIRYSAYRSCIGLTPTVTDQVRMDYFSSLVLLSSYSIDLSQGFPSVEEERSAIRRITLPRPRPRRSSANPTDRRLASTIHQSCPGSRRQSPEHPRQQPVIFTWAAHTALI